MVNMKNVLEDWTAITEEPLLECNLTEYLTKRTF